MAGWFVEGLVEWLTEGGPAAERLLAVGVAVVPRMNPDGVAIGNHRTTPLGRDLNRTWADAEPPVEVAAARAALLRSGAAFFFDVHGDERLPWVFGQPADGLSERARAQIARVEAELVASTRDFQTVHRYPYDPRGKPSLAFASNWAHHSLGCPAVTLEMPFSDHLGRPDPRGFFPARARRLGARVGRALAAVVPPAA
jgi:murein tripeptide amidase MpaA